MDIAVRTYRASDWEEMVGMTATIVDLMAQIDPHKRFRPRSEFDAETYARMSLANAEEKGGRTFVVEADGSIAGYAIAYVEEPDERDALNKFPAKQGYVDALFLKEEFRGQGVGKQLMETIEEYFRNEGCELSSIACVASNTAARALYEKAGYGEQYVHFLKKL